jgi:hypothetical protein
MKFYSDLEATLTVWDGKKGLVFKDGVYETIDKEEIEILKKAGYRHGETIKGDTEGQTPEGEQKPKKKS